MADDSPIAEGIKEPEPATATPPATATGINISLEEKSKTVTLVRDTIISCAGIVYVLGFMVWAYNAWRNNLGLLPAVQFQYFIAGLPFILLAFLVGFVYIAGLYVRCITMYFMHMLHEKIAGDLRSIPARVAASCAICFVLIAIFLATREVNAIFVEGRVGRDLLKYIIGYLGGMFLIGANTIGPENPIHPKDFKIKARNGPLYVFDVVQSSIYFYPLALSVFGWYLLTVYPSVPQEFGGMRPRLAYLDLKRDGLSSSMQAEVLPVSSRKTPKNPTNDAIPIDRSILLDVYYVGSSSMLLRPHGQDVNHSIIEVKTESIAGVKWCRSVEVASADSTSLPLVAPKKQKVIATSNKPAGR